MTEKLIQIVSEAAGSPVQASDSFQDMPIDSLEFVAMIQEVEQAFGVNIEENRIANLVTVNDLLLLVSDLIPA